MRRASASSTDEARAVANASRASPPDSISTTMAATRYSRSAMAVRIETPASRSDPNSRLHNFFRSSQTSGRPPITSARKSGRFEVREGKWKAYFRATCKSIATSVNPAISVSLEGANRVFLVSAIVSTYRTSLSACQRCNILASAGARKTLRQLSSRPACDRHEGRGICFLQR